MIYITGDTHRKFTRIQKFCKQNKTTKDDVMIILGDAGINYYDDDRDIDAKKWLESIPITFLIIRGNHDMRPDINWGIKEIYNDSFSGSFIVEEEFPDILYMQDGEEYTLNTYDGKKRAFVIGGAYSVDKYYRLKAFASGFTDMHWFPDEQLTKEEMKSVKEKLYNILYKKRGVDFIFSHTCPESVIPTEMFLQQVDQSTVDSSMEQFLEEIMSMVCPENGAKMYEKWFCGHWHVDKLAPRDVRFMFNDIISL